MYVNWRALVLFAIVAVAGYFAYQTFWAGTQKRGKMTTAQLLDGYEAGTVLDRELTYAELKARAEKTGMLDAAALRAWFRKKEQAPETYKLACEMLGRIRDRSAADALLKDLAHARAEIRIGATRYFQHAPARRAFDPFLKNLAHPSDEVRKETVVAIENLAAMTNTGVRYKTDVSKWQEWWNALSKAEKSKIPE